MLDDKYFQDCGEGIKGGGKAVRMNVEIGGRSRLIGQDGTNPHEVPSWLAVAVVARRGSRGGSCLEWDAESSGDGGSGVSSIIDPASNDIAHWTVAVGG